MSLKLSEISSYLKFAKGLANLSERIINKHSLQKIKVNFKFDKSPVTKIDKEIEKSFRSLIQKKYPNHGIYGEEYANKKINSSYVWVIDPIDGTKNFINGNGCFGTLISLCREGLPLFGIINSPQLKKRWIGIRDNGAYCNGEKMKKYAINLPLKDLFFSTSGMTAYKSISKNKKYNDLVRKTQYVTLGGDCVQYGLLAEKRIPLVVESFLKPFDYLPLVNVIEETGGVITDWRGKALDFKSNGDVVACVSKKAHKQFLKI